MKINVYILYIYLYIYIYIYFLHFYRIKCQKSGKTSFTLNRLLHGKYGQLKTN